jgi:hypothetical protein
MVSRSGWARSWSGRLKLSFRAVWDSAKIEGLVYTSLGSTKLIKHEILHYPSPPLGHSFVLGTAVIKVVILAR